MSKKYEKEISLRLRGDLVEAKKYISRAREVLGDVWNRDIELGGLDQAWRRVILDDRAYVTVYATTFINPIVTITVITGGETVEKTQYVLRLAWKPEGIVLTPRTAGFPDGWGLPSRDAETGEKLSLELDEEGEQVNEIGLTPGGSLPQVILNRFANNKYLDLTQYVDGLPGEVDGLIAANPQLSPSLAISEGSDVVFYQTAAIFGQPWSYATPDDEGNYLEGFYDGQEFWVEYGVDDELVAGVHKVITVGTQRFSTTLGYQFDANFNELITEAKAADVFNEGTQEFEEQWYCHRPEEKLYVDLVSEGIFQAANIQRVAVNEEPVYRIIRGDANSARMAGYILTQSEGHFFHSHPDFLPGFRTTGGRVANCTGQEPFNAYGDNVRENLAAIPAGNIPGELETPLEVGEWINQLWVNSPGHYANMISEMWTEFGLPFNTWSGLASATKYPDGTQGASHHIGSYGVNTYVDRSQPLDSSVTIPINPPAEDATVWAQIFCARESWLPIYDWLHEGAYGTTGTFNGWNAYSHGNFVSASRRVGWNKHVYQLPLGLVPPQVDPNQNQGEYNAFLSVAGSAMIELDGEKWIRVVYWESDTVIETVEDIGLSTFPQEGDWVRLKVVRFPLKLQESSSLPWRLQEPGVYETEYEFEWLAEDGWLTNPPAKVVFNSTGSKFTFSMHKIGTDVYTDALNYKATHWTDDRSALPLPRVDIQTAHYEWDETILTTLAEMEVYEPTPLVATVECWTDEANSPNPESYTDDDKTTKYERTLQGTIEVFPHYNEEDELTYLILDIDEKTYQKGNRGTANLPDEDSFCYRVRKLVFPSGKEVTYMQQYMQDRWTTHFSKDILDPNYRPWPGTGDENFYCVIHWLDELREDVVYSKIRTEKIVVDYGFPQLWYRVDGDIDYIADLGPKPSQFDVDAPDQIIEVIGTIAYDISRSAFNVYDIDGDNWAHQDALPNSFWIYNTDFSPCMIMAIQGDEYSNVPTGFVGANTTGFNLPEIVATTTLTFSPGPTGPPYDPDDGLYKRPTYRGNPEQAIDYPCGRAPFADYVVSNHTGYTYYGDSNIWYFGSAKYNRSFMRCNISPLFGKPGETRCKVIRYDGRIVVYIGLDHVHQAGLNPPTYFKPEGSTFAWSEWTPNPPPEDQEQFIWANFDLDEAVGIEDINDIWPLGKIV